MTETRPRIEGPRPLHGASAPCSGDALVLARRRRGRGRSGRLPPPPAAGVAAARGRDARALRRPPSARRALPGRARGARRRAAPLPPRLGGRAPRARARRRSGSSRRRSRSRACRSSALLGQAARRDGRPRSIATVARRRELDVPLPRRLRAGCTASSCSRARSRSWRSCARSSAATGARGRSGLLAILATVASHPYGALVARAQAAFVLVAHRERLRAGRRRLRGASVCAGIPFWFTDLVLAGRFDVGVGGRRKAARRAVARRHSISGTTAGDFTAGRWPVLVPVLGLARAGRADGAATDARARRLRGRGADPRVPRRAARRLGLARDAAPDLRPPVRRPPSSARGSSGSRLAAARRPRGRSWSRRSPGRGTRTRPLFEWEPDARQAARAEASTWLAATSRPDDVLFGFEPLYLGAWERNPDFPLTVLPRADSNLALRTLLELDRPLGRGVWVLDASERNNIKPALEIDYRGAEARARRS